MKSELKPIPFLETSLAKIKSQFFFHFKYRILIIFLVSAEKPATIWGLFLLFLDKKSNISLFLIKFIDLKFNLFFFYFIFTFFNRLKISYCAVHTAKSTGKVFLTSFNISSADIIFFTLISFGQASLEGPVINVVFIPSLFSAIAIS